MKGFPLSSAKVYLSKLTPGDPWAAVFIGFGRDEDRLRWEYRYLSMPGGRLGGDYTEWELEPVDEEDEEVDEAPVPAEWELDFVAMTMSEVARGVSARLLTEEHEDPERVPGFLEVAEVTEVAGAFRVELGGCDDDRRRCQEALARLREEARLTPVREAIETAFVAERGGAPA